MNPPRPGPAATQVIHSKARGFALAPESVDDAQDVADSRRAQPRTEEIVGEALHCEGGIPGCTHPPPAAGEELGVEGVLASIEFENGRAVVASCDVVVECIQD
jgi:hypothetical protein